MHAMLILLNELNRVHRAGFKKVLRGEWGKTGLTPEQEVVAEV